MKSESLDGLVEPNRRMCHACLTWRQIEKFDSCWGELPGVDSACCGHGETDGYIKFENGIIVRYLIFSQMSLEPLHLLIISL